MNEPNLLGCRYFESHSCSSSLFVLSMSCDSDSYLARGSIYNFWFCWFPVSVECNVFPCWLRSGFLGELASMRFLPAIWYCSAHGLQGVNNWIVEFSIMLRFPTRFRCRQVNGFQPLYSIACSVVVLSSQLCRSFVCVDSCFFFLNLEGASHLRNFAKSFRSASGFSHIFVCPRSRLMSLDFKRFPKRGFACNSALVRTFAYAWRMSRR